MKPLSGAIAWFVSPHGFGHAARASAVMETVHDLDPSIRFEVFTTIPEWFFRETLDGAFGYHVLETDVGFVQKTPFQEDLTQTKSALDRFLPFPEERITDLALKIGNLACRLVVCDISAMGIAVAEEAKIPSVLLENFTWDWIYRNYPKSAQMLETYSEYLKKWYQAATHHIQTEPICSRQAVDLSVGPASRKARKDRTVTRRRFQIKEEEKLVLVTAGGVPTGRPSIDALRQFRNIRFVIPGLTEAKREDNVLCLNRTSAYFHPDLVEASDAVIGKAGYSTIAEVFHSGVPFGYVSRSDFPESIVLSDFIDKEMAGISIDQGVFRTGDWGEELERLLSMPRQETIVPNGAEGIAEYLMNVLNS